MSRWAKKRRIVLSKENCAYEVSFLTRDQLFLTLRIASLERYLTENPPMPFVVDDILISFDDERASAALAVLAELSRQTQVVFCTYHKRLVEIVQKLQQPDVIFVQELGNAQPQVAHARPANA